MYPLKIVGICLLAVLILIVVFFPKENTILTLSRIENQSHAQTNLSFSPNPVIATESAQVGIIIDTGGNEVKFVQIKLSFHPNLMYDLTFEKGPLFTNAEVLHEFVDQQNGTASYILNIPVKDKGIRGKGILATVRFHNYLKNGESTSLSFTSQTFVTDALSPNSVLKKTTDLKIIRKDKQ